jgi:hypothetical protein
MVVRVTGAPVDKGEQDEAGPCKYTSPLRAFQPSMTV